MQVLMIIMPVPVLGIKTHKGLESIDFLKCISLQTWQNWLLNENMKIFRLDQGFNFCNQGVSLRTDKKELVPEILSLRFSLEDGIIEGHNFLLEFGLFVCCHFLKPFLNRFVKALMHFLWFCPSLEEQTNSVSSSTGPVEQIVFGYKENHSVFPFTSSFPLSSSASFAFSLSSLSFAASCLAVLAFFCILNISNNWLYQSILRF